MTKFETFENYLQEVHAEDYLGTDDDMPDAFDYWVTNLDNAELLDLCETYGLKMWRKGIQRASEIILESQKNVIKIK